jgi:hypothetical protein
VCSEYSWNSVAVHGSDLDETRRYERSSNEFNCIINDSDFSCFDIHGMGNGDNADTWSDLGVI